MTIDIPVPTVKNVLVDTVALIAKLGVTVRYTFASGAPGLTMRVIKQRLTEQEIVGSYREGDCRFVIDATVLKIFPEKFDKLTTIDAHVQEFILVDVIACEKALDDTVLIYAPVGRGT